MKKTNTAFFEEKIFAGLSEFCQKIYLELLKYTDEVIDGIELTKLVLPDSAADLIDSTKLMELPVKDVKGNIVCLGDYIENNKVTVLNFWGTFCGTCVMEMPVLDKLDKKYHDDGFGIVGVCVDIVNDENKVLEDHLERGKYIIEDTGVTYPCVYAPYEINDVYDFSAYPTTLFIDSEGNVLRDPVLGSDSESGWTKTIEKVLKNK